MTHDKILRGCREGGAVGHIERINADPGREGVGERLQLRCAPRGQAQGGAALGVMPRRGGADAPGGAGDENLLRHRHRYFPRSLRASSTSWSTTRMSSRVPPARRAEVTNFPSTTILCT